MTTANVIELARKHVGTGNMVDSARVCLSDAVEMSNRGNLELAKVRAVKSLAYSVGILHADYQRAVK